MKVIVFDTETTGFPLGRNVPPFMSGNYNSARMIEIGYILMENNEIIKKVDHLIKHDEYIELTNSHIHGITMNMLNIQGKKMTDVLYELEKDIKDVDLIISHNFKFDFSILMSEIYRYYPIFNTLLGYMYSKPSYCTMLHGMKYLQQRKWPKLKDLYLHLYPMSSYEQTHRALDDAEICAKCYLKLINDQ